MVGSIITRIGLLSFWSRFIARASRRLETLNLNSGPGVQTLTSRLPVADGQSLPEVGDSPLGTTEISGLSKTEAEDLLDWLEATGDNRWELAAINGSGFVLRRK